MPIPIRYALCLEVLLEQVWSANHPCLQLIHSPYGIAIREQWDVQLIFHCCPIAENLSLKQVLSHNHSDNINQINNTSLCPATSSKSSAHVSLWKAILSISEWAGETQLPLPRHLLPCRGESSKNNENAALTWPLQPADGSGLGVSSALHFTLRLNVRLCFAFVVICSIFRIPRLRAPLLCVCFLPLLCVFYSLQYRCVWERWRR